MNPEPKQAASANTRLHRIITRHPEAADWVRQQVGHAVEVAPHLEPGEIESDAHYYGVLPLHLAAAICEKGSAFWAISVQVPSTLRGQELSALQLQGLGARLMRYEVQAVEQFRRPDLAPASAQA